MSRRSIGRHDDPDATRQRWMRRHPMNRFGTAQEVARAIMFLASDDASFTHRQPALRGRRLDRHVIAHNSKGLHR